MRLILLLELERAEKSSVEKTCLGRQAFVFFVSFSRFLFNVLKNFKLSLKNSCFVEKNLIIL